MENAQRFFRKVEETVKSFKKPNNAGPIDTLIQSSDLSNVA